MSFEEYVSHLSPQLRRNTIKFTEDRLTDAKKVIENANIFEKLTKKMEYLRAYCKYFRFNGLDTYDLDEALLYISPQYYESLGDRKEAKELVELYKDKKYSEYVALFLEKNYQFSDNYHIIGVDSDKKHLNTLEMKNKFIVFRTSDKITRIYHRKFRSSVEQVLAGMMCQLEQASDS
jgi:hypothetical protein